MCEVSSIDIAFHDRRRKRIRDPQPERADRVVSIDPFGTIEIEIVTDLWIDGLEQALLGRERQRERIWVGLRPC